MMKSKKYNYTAVSYAPLSCDGASPIVIHKSDDVDHKKDHDEHRRFWNPCKTIDWLCDWLIEWVSEYVSECVSEWVG